MSSLSKSPAPKPLALQASDGTLLSYYQLGSGPGLIIIPGAMSSALSQLELGTALSRNYSVYLFSRRSRGLSGPYPEKLTSVENPISESAVSGNGELTHVYEPSFSAEVLKVDLEDLATLMRHTGSTYLLGISSGAVLTLEACVSPTVVVPPIQKAVVFEPPLQFNISPPSTKGIDISGLLRYEQEMKDGNVAGALVTAMMVAQLGPGWLRACPRWIIKFLTKLILNAEAKDESRKKEEGREDEGAVTMEALAPALRYDFALIEAVAGSPERFKEAAKAPNREILLLGGDLSPPYIRYAMKELASITKNDNGTVAVVEVKGVGHELLENKIRNGKVEKAVDIVREFLGGKVGMQGDSK